VAKEKLAIFERAMGEHFKKQIDRVQKESAEAE